MTMDKLKSTVASEVVQELCKICDLDPEVEKQFTAIIGNVLNKYFLYITEQVTMKTKVGLKKKRRASNRKPCKNAYHFFVAQQMKHAKNAEQESKKRMKLIGRWWKSSLLYDNYYNNNNNYDIIANKFLDFYKKYNRESYRSTLSLRYYNNSRFIYNTKQGNIKSNNSISKNFISNNTYNNLKFGNFNANNNKMNINNLSKKNYLSKKNNKRNIYYL